MMNRTIKYRGIDVVSKEWVYGHYFEGSHGHYIGEPSTGKLWQIDPKTVGQFTGLNDKNVVEIYENDILRTEFNDQSYTDMKVCFGDTFEFMKDGYYGWYCEIVGSEGVRVNNKYCQLNSSVRSTSFVNGSVFTHPHLIQ